MSAGVYRPKRDVPGSSQDWSQWSRKSGPLLMDGATGTELERRGVPTPLPLWSASAIVEAPDILRDIHTAYLEGGAQIVTANTFRTQRRALAHGHWEDRAASLTARAVEIAREAREAVAPDAWVFGSAPTLEDCYRPDRVPSREILETEHTSHIENLVHAGVDGIVVETMNTRLEAEIATRVAHRTGLRVFTSFVCGHQARLLSGERLEEAAQAATDAGADALLVNCLPPSQVPACLEVFANQTLPFGVYANLGEPADQNGFLRSESCSPEEFARLASRAREAGARLLGGCCGTTPAHVTAVAHTLGSATRC